jgi:signal transduction histidine kinase
VPWDRRSDGARWANGGQRRRFERPRGRYRGGPPPWWPEGQLWSPDNPEYLRHRRQFLRRAVIFLGFLVLLITISCTALISAAGFAVGFFHASAEPDFRPGFAFIRPVATIFAIMLFTAGAIVTSFAIRRVANPVGKWLEAAGRVEAGDYGVRIEENGPREIRSVARAFNQMTARLQKDEEERRRLLADITHELRTPLTVVQGQLEGIIDGVYAPDTERMELILDETKVLARLIDDLRTLSLAEHGGLQLHLETTDLAVLVEECADAFCRTAADAGVDLHANIAGEIPLFDVDPVRIREVLGNLLANALRYTPKGGAIIIELCADAKCVTLIVKDNGRGIPPDILPHIFDRFVKSEDSRGSGLGLAIVKNLITLHGGEIRAESEVGKGTTMTVTLPAE